MHGIYTDVLYGVCTQTFCAWCYQWRQDGSAAGAVWAAKVGYRPFRFYSVTENWNAWLLFACLTFVWPCGLLELWTVSSVLHLRKITVIPAVWSAAGISARSVTLHTVHCRPDPFNWKFRFPTTSLCWWFTNSRLFVALTPVTSSSWPESILFVLAQFTNVTDGQTSHDDVGCAYASHRIARQNLEWWG